MKLNDIYQLFSKNLKLFLLLSIFFSIINVKGYTREATVINVKTLKTKIIEQKSNRFLILDPEIASIELSDNYISIKGLKPGSTTLFIWNGDEMTPFIIKTLPLENNIRPIIYQVKNSENLSMGHYNVQAFSALSPQESFNLGNQFINHSLDFQTPLFNGESFFNLNVSNFFKNRTQLENIILDSFLFNYKNNSFSIDVGDATLPFSKLNSFNPNFRGMKLQLNLNPQDYISLFSGFERRPFYLYGTESNIINNSIYNLGLSGKYNLLSNLVVIGNLRAKVSSLTSTNKASNQVIVNPDSNKFDFSTNLKWIPFDNLVSNNEISTTFNSFALLSENDFIYHWLNRSEWLELKAKLNYFGKNYFNSSDKDSLNYYFSSKINFFQDLLLSSEYNKFEDNFFNVNMFNFRISKPLIKDLTAYTMISFSNNNVNPDTSKKNIYYQNYELGLSNNFFIPINLSYNYFYNKNNDELGSNNIRVSTNIFNNSFIQLLANSTLGINTSNSFDRSLGLNSFIRFTKEFNLNLNMDYNYLSQEKLSYLNTNIKTSLKFEPFHQLSLNILLNNRFNDLNNIFFINSSIQYIYNFGEAYSSKVQEGSVSGVVFEDLNNNGVFDEKEPVIPNIKINFNDKNLKTNKNGFILEKIPFGSYEISVDKNTLPNNYDFTTTSTDTIDVNAEKQVINFGISNKVKLRGIVYANKKNKIGLSDIKVILDNNQVTYTDIEGYFYFSALAGKHKLTLSPDSFPESYYLDEEFEKNIDLNTKSDTFILSFKPLITLTGNIIANTANYNNLKLNVTLKTDISEKTLKLAIDKNGIFFLNDLETGILEINSPLLHEPIKITIPDNPVDLKVTINLKK